MARTETELGILLVFFQALHHLNGSVVVPGWVSDWRVTYFRDGYPKVVEATYDPLKNLRLLGEQKPSSRYFVVLQAAGNISSIAFNKERVVSYYKNGQGNYTLANRASITREVLNQLNSTYFPTMSRYCTEYPDACGYLTPPLFFHHMKGLHRFMDKFYEALLYAFDTAATELERNETAGGEPEICKNSTERLWCEVQILQSMMDKNCSRIMDSKCTTPGFSKHLLSEDSVCPLSGTAYPYKLIDIVRVRQVYLALGIAFCGGLREGGREVEMVSVMADFSSAAQRWESEAPSSAVWTHPSVTIANEEADRLGLTKGWPMSSAVVSNYTKLASSIDRRMNDTWKEDIFSSIVFHPSTESAYAIIGDIGKPQQQVETKEQFSKNAGDFQSPSVPRMFFIQREDANILISRRRESCSDAQQKDWFERNKGEIIQHFTPRKKASPTELKDDFEDIPGWNKCFQGAAIIKCAYRFVWHELAWTYYKSFSSCKFCTDIGDENYGQCLRIAFIP